VASSENVDLLKSSYPHSGELACRAVGFGPTNENGQSKIRGWISGRAGGSGANAAHRPVFDPCHAQNPDTHP